MIELTKISVKHKDSFVRLLNNKNIEKWLLMIPSPYTNDDADFWIKKCQNDYGGNRDFAYAIENDGIHVGGIGLHRRHQHSAEVGYWMGEEYWGKGYATEALNKILDIGFNELKFDRIQAHVFEGNIPSEKLLLRCGFEYEGLLKKCHKKGEVFYNSKLFAKVI
ncbi:MAG: GNAT family N-acetyltransferase [bacterium]